MSVRVRIHVAQISLTVENVGLLENLKCRLSPLAGPEGTTYAEQCVPFASDEKNHIITVKPTISDPNTFTCMHDIYILYYELRF